MAGDEAAQPFLRGHLQVDGRMEVGAKARPEEEAAVDKHDGARRHLGWLVTEGRVGDPAEAASHDRLAGPQGIEQERLQGVKVVGVLEVALWENAPRRWRTARGCSKWSAWTRTTGTVSVSERCSARRSARVVFPAASPPSIATTRVAPPARSTRRSESSSRSPPARPRHDGPPTPLGVSLTGIGRTEGVPFAVRRSPCSPGRLRQAGSGSTRKVS